MRYVVRCICMSIYIYMYNVGCCVCVQRTKGFGEFDPNKPRSVEDLAREQEANEYNDKK
jgi:hypothetical protein